MQHWEYMRLDLLQCAERPRAVADERVGHFRQPEAVLNTLSTQGWEVVDEDYPTRPIVTLRRLLETGETECRGWAHASHATPCTHSTVPCAY